MQVPGQYNNLLIKDGWLMKNGWEEAMNDDRQQQLLTTVKDMGIDNYELVYGGNNKKNRRRLYMKHTHYEAHTLNQQFRMLTIIAYMN